MRISIITVSYNSCDTIRDTINSVVKQNYSDIEYIIVDGGSTDNTLEIVRSYKNHNIRWVSEPDKGIYDAMNKGLQMATGDVIGILNSDDFYVDKYVISKIASKFEETDADSLYGDLAYVDAGKTSKILRYWRSGHYKRGSFLHGWMPPHPTFFVKREIYQKYKAFDLRLKSAADYELMLRLLYKQNISVAYLPELLVFMRSGGKSNASLNNRMRANMEDRMAWKINGLNPSPLTLFLKPLRKIEQYLFISHRFQIPKSLYNQTDQYEIKSNPEFNL
jgi:glycosyltransferase